MFTPKQLIGNFGEKEAIKFLKKKKYRILEKNWRHKHGEIDIIAVDSDIIVFIEVRTRKEDALVPGYFSISSHKKNVMRETCMAYICENFVKFYRFDVIEIAYSSSSSEIFHYENVPLF